MFHNDDRFAAVKFFHNFLGCFSDIHAPAGAFFVGQSRSKSFRWLRPVGAWLLAGFGVMFCAMIASLFTHNGMTRIDDLIARVIFWIFAVLGAEFVASFVIEFYRPRTLKEQRPIFESRLLALFTEPGGVMRNIASALDYQFGFKVSGTWLYSFLERSFFPLVLVWAVILWGFTMIHEVGPSEVGVRETFGRVTEEKLLEPGIYWTLPWPMGTVKRFSCTEIQQVVVGELHDEKGDDGQPSKKAADSVVLWTNPHGGDDNNFLVTNTYRTDNGNQGSLAVQKHLDLPMKADGTPEAYPAVRFQLTRWWQLNVNAIAIRQAQRVYCQNG